MGEDVHTDVSPELSGAFTELVDAFNRLAPLAEREMQEQDPQRHGELMDYVAAGDGAMRAVFVPKHGVLQFELLDENGAWAPFYRLMGKGVGE